MEGALLFAGEFDERDVQMASRAYPGRRVEIDAEGLWVCPQEAGD